MAWLPHSVNLESPAYKFFWLRAEPSASISTDGTLSGRTHAKEESTMAGIAYALSGIAGLGSLVCFILVVVQMFQRGQTGLGIACIVLIFCCGIGGLIVFVYGWIKASSWGIQNIMLVWTACIVLGIIAGVLNPAQFQQLQQFGLPAR
jgi:hypothetical protein